jgi:hypothetical protein
VRIVVGLDDGVRVGVVGGVNVGVVMTASMIIPETVGVDVGGHEELDVCVAVAVWVGFQIEAGFVAGLDQGVWGVVVGVDVGVDMNERMIISGDVGVYVGVDVGLAVCVDEVESGTRRH